jgi:uncharacterized HAD superfamily protein
MPDEFQWSDPSCYIFDLDGTISNNLHRLSLLKDPANWEKYNELAIQDTPFWYIRQLMVCLHLSAPRLYISTTRTETYRHLTEEWLEMYDIPYDMLLMAQVGDKRSHAEIKKSMVDFIRADGYRIILAFDDRPSVIKMFRSNGIPCLAMSDEYWKLDWNKDE